VKPMIEEDSTMIEEGSTRLEARSAVLGTSNVSVKTFKKRTFSMRVGIVRVSLYQ